MHKYASSSPDSRELVAELEFVWDQVKSNVPSSESSSPMRTLSRGGMPVPHSSHLAQSGQAGMAGEEDDKPLQLKSPMSQSEEELEEEEAEIDQEEEFVDAPDSQYNPTSEDAGVQTDFQNLIRQQPIPISTPTPIPRIRSILPQPIPMPNFSGRRAKEGVNESPTDQKWRKRVEQALVKMTAEVAALREQLEARRLFSHSPHYRFFRGVWRFLWSAMKHIIIDALVLSVVLFILRKKKNERLEGAMRVLLGTAVAQVQKVGKASGVQLSKVKLPTLAAKKSS